MAETVWRLIYPPEMKCSTCRFRWREFCTSPDIRSSTARIYPSVVAERKVKRTVAERWCLNRYYQPRGGCDGQ